MNGYAGFKIVGNGFATTGKTVVRFPAFAKSIKHRAKTFGTSANYNKATHAKFTAEIKGHMQNSNTQVKCQ